MKKSIFLMCLFIFICFLFTGKILFADNHLEVQEYVAERFPNSEVEKIIFDKDNNKYLLVNLSPRFSSANQIYGNKKYEIQKYNPKQNLLCTWNVTDEKGNIYIPYDIAISPQNKIYILTRDFIYDDPEHCELQIFDLNGLFLKRFKISGLDRLLMALVFDKKGNLFTAENNSTTNRILKFDKDLKIRKEIKFKVDNEAIFIDRLWLNPKDENKLFVSVQSFEDIYANTMIYKVDIKRGTIKKTNLNKLNFL